MEDTDRAKERETEQKRGRERDLMGWLFTHDLDAAEPLLKTAGCMGVPLGLKHYPAHYTFKGTIWDWYIHLGICVAGCGSVVV